jgi:Virulence factor BrkB
MKNEQLDTRRGRASRLWTIMRDTTNRFVEDRCPMMGASIGFYSAFSLAPTLLIVLAIVGWFFGAEAGKGRFFEQVKAIMGADAASAMQSIAEHAHRAQGGRIAAALSVVLLIVGASAFSSLNNCSRRGVPGEAHQGYRRRCLACANACALVRALDGTGLPARRFGGAGRGYSVFGRCDSWQHDHVRRGNGRAVSAEACGPDRRSRRPDQVVARYQGRDMPCGARRSGCRRPLCHRPPSIWSLPGPRGHCGIFRRCRLAGRAHDVAVFLRPERWPRNAMGRRSGAVVTQVIIIVWRPGEYSAAMALRVAPPHVAGQDRIGNT